MPKLMNFLYQFPLVAIDCPAIDRAEILRHLEKAAVGLDLRLSSWSIIDSPAKIFDPISNIQLSAQILYVLEDFFLASTAFPNVDQEICYQMISNLYQQMSDVSISKGCRIVFINTPSMGPPPRLMNLFDHYEMPFPTLETISEVFSAHGFQLDTDPRLLNITSGLSTEEIRKGLRSCRSESLVADFSAYRRKVLARLGLEFVETAGATDIGGLERVQESLRQVILDFRPEASKFKISTPKGMALVGVPGTGKTYLAKVAANLMGFELVNIGIDIVKSGGILSLKRLLKTLDQIPNIIIYFDEFDKFFNGADSLDLLGVILPWLNDKCSKSYVIATLNRIENLPPELTRAGRFDKTFFVDSPNEAGRQKILQLHCAKYDRRFQEGYGPFSIAQWVEILEATNEFVGSELAQVADEAARDSYYELLAAGSLSIEAGTLLVDGQVSDFQLEIHFNALIDRIHNINSLFNRNAEGILRIRNKAATMAEPASHSSEDSPFKLASINIYSYQ